MSDKFILGLIWLGVFGTMIMGFAAYSDNKIDAILTVDDCVMAHWVEYEERVGDMPTISMEVEWQRECSLYLNKEA